MFVKAKNTEKTVAMRFLNVHYCISFVRMIIKKRNYGLTSACHSLFVLQL